MPSYRSTSSITSNLMENQQEIQDTLSKDSIDRQQHDQTSSTNESLARYVKMLLERSPTHDQKASQSKDEKQKYISIDFDSSSHFRTSIS